jgi:hypothetical protein
MVFCAADYQTEFQDGRRLVTDSIEPIIRRALRFAATLDWVNPVVDVRPADEQVVLQRGSGDASGYRTVRIEMQLGHNVRRKMIKHAERAEADVVKRLLEGPWTLDVTCNATDVILDRTPFID